MSLWLSGSRRGRGGEVRLGKGTSGLSTNATHHAMQRPAALSHRPVKGPFCLFASPVQYHGTPNTAIAVLSASAAFSYGGTW